ncbi:putative enzyme related to lactoylglutathione lyase [Rhizomicrobium palustre]|uniref:Putative enzyme related to lactoylglutathione lyase n=1 Tax=Rhizomicrobium palustre TaxID=189966 RepID=A0A846MVQ5_9PROT|nr:glyoxalase [Rhizomicrobium palustre]NIK87574.1 putative enzyme related to lactoylglutathione lyase [Rhizomicrobium palustre]
MRKFTVGVLAGVALAGLWVTPLEAKNFSVGPQYDTTHVYVAPEDYDRFMASFVATFGGKLSKQGVFQVTPTPSQTVSQLALTPVGTISTFGFKTPVPYPFGAERTGYLVTDIDAAVKAARKAGATVLVSTFLDPIGKDAVITWPGGVNMQLYWHTTAPNYPALATVPENRVYVSPDAANAFIHDFVAFAHANVVSDVANAPGEEIGKPGTTYRRVRIESGYGKMVVLVTNGQLPWPYGRETTGYEVPDLDATLMKAKAAGVTVVNEPAISGNRKAAMVQFPGGYVAEIHAVAP